MDWTPIIIAILPPLLTFLIGLVMNKPGYKKGKNVAATISKALEDDQVTADELQEIINLFKPQPE